MMNRADYLQKLQEIDKWDIIIIGGGATGLGIAVDAASRGLKTLLLEKCDFAKATSSRSTKLVHGGVRYLAKGEVKLVYSALYERGLIFKNAPHLASIQSFIIPCYSTFSKLKFLIGLKLYDWMAGKNRIGRSVALNKSQTLQKLPTLKAEKIKGGVQYFDGQFDDARMAISLAQTAAAYGATLCNYTEVTALNTTDNKIAGLTFKDRESDKEYLVKSKVVVNATGVFVDDILKMLSGVHRPIVRPSQGTHLVIDKKFLAGNDALMIPETSDGRVLFGVPWHNHVLLGTTDIPLDHHSDEPRPMEKEINFILQTAAEYLTIPPQKKDILSVFAGLRPLAAPKNSAKDSTKEISRDHKLIVSAKGMITITGGKWTTYRKMAEETVDKAVQIGHLQADACQTKDLHLHGYQESVEESFWKYYGADAAEIQKMASDNKELSELLHPDHPYIKAQVIWAIEKEMARTVEDILSRRIRLLILNAEDSLECAPWVARVLKEKLYKTDEWEQQQIKEYAELVKNYQCIQII